MNAAVDIPPVAVVEPARIMFRNAMARLAAAVHVVTTDGPFGRAGLTATAVCSVSDAPPTILVCVNGRSSSLEPLLGNGVFCVNTLSADQQAVSQAFGAGGSIDQRFQAAGDWLAAPSGAPRLDGALASLDCKVAGVADQGSHKVIFAHVTDISMQEEAGALVYFQRHYRQLQA